MSLANLAQFAAKPAAATSSRTPQEDLIIEAARAVVKVGDGNRKPNEDGSQALVLRFGKLVLGLDVIAEGATRINATKDQVANFSAQLLAGVAEGAFDGAIIEAQDKIRQQKAQPKAQKVVTESNVPEPTEVAVDAPVAEADIDGLDLASL